MALKFRASIRSPNLEDLESNVLRTYANAIRSELEDRTPGKAASAWSISGPESSVITISNDTTYVPFIERGTGLYGPRGAWIVPRQSRFLSWMAGGQRIFAKKTRGMRPQPFIKQAIAAGMEAAHANV
jgi:hypothetical protein